MSAPAGAQEPGAGTATPGFVVMDFADVELADLIKSMAKISGKRFVYDDRVKGTVNIISEEPISPEAAFRMFESVLQLKGYTLVPGTTGELKIIPTREVRNTPVAVTGIDGEVERRDVFSTRVIPLRFVKVSQIEGTLRQFASSEASVIGDVRTNTLIVTDTGTNIGRMMDLIEQVDIRLFQEEVKVLPLEYADAVELTAQLEEIFSSEGAAAEPSAGRAARQASLLRSRAQAAAAAARAAAAAAGDGPDPGGGGEALGGLMGASTEPRFIPDERTNAILVMAPQSTLEEVERIVQLLDYSRPARGRLNIYQLKNADAEEMAATLSSLMEESSGTRRGSGVVAAGGQTPGGPGGPRGVGAGAAAVAAGDIPPVAVLDSGLRVTAEAATNSLLIQGSAQAYDALVPVIERLDVRRPQVLIEGLVLEVGVDDSEDFGVNLAQTLLSKSDPNDPRSFTVVSTGPPLPETAAFGWEFIKNSKFLDASGDPISLIEATVRASRSNGDTNIMAAPQILTSDNEEAQIVVGENRPFPTQQIRAAGTAVDDVGDRFNTSTAVERRDVGITLRVTPQISEGDSVRMNIYTEISSVKPGADSGGLDLGPITNRRTIENTVHVSDGESVMIGGIIQDTSETSYTRVPFLGDLPLIGRLFGFRNEKTAKTNLMLLLTPHIVRAPEDLEQLTLENREKFRSASGSEGDAEEAERRRKALDAGLDLPQDENPVRRELESLEQRYPTDSLPRLREEREEREEERLRRLDEQRRSLGSGGGPPLPPRRPSRRGDRAPEPGSAADPGSGSGASEAPAPGEAAPRDEPEAEPARPDDAYLVQIEPQDDATESLELLTELNGMGLQGKVILQQQGGRSRYYIRLGPFSSEDEARTAGLQVERETGLDAFVMLGTLE